MQANLEQKIIPRNAMNEADKKKRLSLNLHTMPQTGNGNWKKWLILGFLILALFVLVSFSLYYFKP